MSDSKYRIEFRDAHGVPISLPEEPRARALFLAPRTLPDDWAALSILIPGWAHERTIEVRIIRYKEELT